MYRSFLKRLIDFSLVFCALMICFPVLFIITLWLHFANKGAGVFFLQNRPGRDGKIFKVIKFKTMTDERDSKGNLLPDEQRLTKVGKFVRSTSIDELPQLINVLKGDMALIGPRPDSASYFSQYSEEERKILKVRPGVTGYNQAINRNAVGTKEKLKNDIYYVEHMSFLFDVKIICMTVKTVLFRKNIYRVDKG